MLSYSFNLQFTYLSIYYLTNLKDFKMTEIIYTSLSFITSAIISGFIIHSFIIRREKSKNILNNLEKISNNVIELERLYNEYYYFCNEYNFEKAFKIEKKFFKLHTKTYNMIYFSYEEFLESFIDNMKEIINALEDVKLNAKNRNKKDEFNIKRDNTTEVLYENQSHHNSTIYFGEIYEFLKWKMQYPLKELIPSSLDNIKRYNRT